MAEDLKGLRVAVLLRVEPKAQQIARGMDQAGKPIAVDPPWTVAARLRRA